MSTTSPHFYSNLKKIEGKGKIESKGSPQSQDSKRQTAQQQFEYRFNGKTDEGQTESVARTRKTNPTEMTPLPGFFREGAPDIQILKINCIGKIELNRNVSYNCC